MVFRESPMNPAHQYYIIIIIIYYHTRYTITRNQR
jgi:hypothetical protein